MKKLTIVLFSVICVMLLTLTNVGIVRAEGEDVAPTEPAPTEEPEMVEVTVSVEKVWPADAELEEGTSVDLTIEGTKEPTKTVDAEDNWTAEFVVEVPKDEATQLAQNKAWALVNLICTVASLILALVLFIAKKNNEEDEEERLNKINNDEEVEDIFHRNNWSKWAASLLTILAAILFILTEDVRLPMVLTDKWTILHVVGLIATLLVFARGLHKEYDYTITYFLNGEAYKVETLKYDDEITVETPVQEGFRFSGWDVELPEKMPKENLEVHGTMMAA